MAYLGEAKVGPGEKEVMSWANGKEVLRGRVGKRVIRTEGVCPEGEPSWGYRYFSESPSLFVHLKPENQYIIK